MKENKLDPNHAVPKQKLLNLTTITSMSRWSTSHETRNSSIFGGIFFVGWQEEERRKKKIHSSYYLLRVTATVSVPE